jgi:N-acetylmuramic acid 6-phosphate etherase
MALQRPGVSAPPPTDDAGLDALATEAVSEAGADYDLRTTVELVELMNDHDASVPGAVRAASKTIAATAEEIAESLRRGGRLVYVGAGSSGRIAALDASECETTFSTPPGQVVALVAGGAHTPPLEQLAAEDDAASGAVDIAELELRAEDFVVGVSASGRTPYVLAAVEAARAAGTHTACVVAVEGSPLEDLAERAIVVDVGPEFLAGSTRLKSGTAQKLVLNMLSTISMIRLGKTFGNLMVDVSATNEKLRSRVRRIVRAATGASPDQVEEALTAAHGDAKVAIVSLLANVDAAEARARLDEAEQSVRLAVRR